MSFLIVIGLIMPVLEFILVLTAIYTLVVLLKALNIYIRNNS
ncbi:MAG: hypothetical protein K0S01_2589 [Herbinix sp.]|jgi:hypothetical protein|nr:hypothetical protein [Herbinix sp.]